MLSYVQLLLDKVNNIITYSKTDNTIFGSYNIVEKNE